MSIVVVTHSSSSHKATHVNCIEAYGNDLSLDENDTQEFNDWYIKQPIAKDIVEIYGLVGTRSNGDGQIGFHHNFGLGQRYKEESS